MSIVDTLRRFEEPLPKWLRDYREGDPFNREKFFSSRIVFYPGSGTDGHAIKLFNRAHAAHVFVYADYQLKREEIEAQLRSGDPGHFRGYHRATTLEVAEGDLTPDGWRPHIRKSELEEIAYRDVNRFGFIAVLERDAGFNEAHGAARFAVLFLGADGISTYDALFCQGTASPAPYALLLQDHGFGGNYDRFGKGGLLEDIARRANVLPTWLVVGGGTQAWDGYACIPGVRGDRGGMHHAFLRRLYARERVKVKK